YFHVTGVQTCALPISAYLALAPWLDEQTDVVETTVRVTFALALLTYCIFLAASVNRRLDEVQIAGQRIAQTRGMTLGVLIAVLLLTFPPSMNALVSLAESIASGSPEKAVRVAIVLGFMLVV